MVLSGCCHVQLSIKEGEISTGLGKQSKEFDIERKIKIVYLDDNLRIARWELHKHQLVQQQWQQQQQQQHGRGSSNCTTTSASNKRCVMQLQAIHI